jgi:hypothetical protein
VTVDAGTPPIVMSPFTLKEKLLALDEDDAKAKGLKNVFALSSNLMRINS